MGRSKVSEATETPAPPRPRRMRIWSTIVVSLLAGLAVFAVLALLGRPVPVPDSLRERVSDRLAQTLPGLDVEFGELAIELTHDFRARLYLRNVAVRDASGVTVGDLGALQADFALGPLLAREVRPKTVSISGVALDLLRNPDGSFSFAFGNAAPVGEAMSVPAIIAMVDSVFRAPVLTNFSALDVEALTVRYEDTRAKRAWTVDGGRLRVDREGDDLRLSGDVALLGGGADIATLELSGETRLGETAAQFGVAFDGMPARDIAVQAPALAWLDVLRAPISGALRAGLDNDGALLPLNATLQIGAGVLQPNDQTRPIPFRSARSYFTFDPETGTLQFDELSVDSEWVTAAAEGRAHLTEFNGGWPREFLSQIRLTTVEANPAGVFPEPVNVDGAEIDARIRLNPFEVSLGRMTVVDQGVPLNVTGRLAAEEEGWDLALRGRMDTLAMDRVNTFWPADFKPGTRNWIFNNISKMDIRDVQVALDARPTEKRQLYLGFEFSDAEVQFMRTMPPIRAASGRMTLHENRLVVTADAGKITADSGGLVDIAGTSLVVLDNRIKDPPSEILVQTESTITAALSLLNRPPFGFMDRMGRPAALADGRAEVTGRIRLPLKKKMKPGEARFEIGGRLSNVRSEVLVPDRVLAGSSLQVVANNEVMSISGEGRVGRVPFSGTFSHPFDPKADAPRFDARMELSEQFIDEFNIALPPGTLSGVAEADVTLQLNRDGPITFSLASELAGAGLNIPPLSWSLPRNARGGLAVEGTLTQPPTVDRLALDAPGLFAEGNLTLTEEGGLNVADFTELRAGRWLNAAVDLRGRGNGRMPVVRVKSGEVDLRNRPGDDTPAANATAGSDTPVIVVLDRLRISEGLEITDFKGDFINRGGLDGRFVGKLNGQADVRGQLVPQDGRSGVRIFADDAGDVIRAAGIFETVEDGDMVLSLAPRGPDGHFDGALEIKNTRVRDAPVLASMLSAISVVGALEQMSGQGLVFGEVDARFRLTPERLIVTRSSAVGPSMGISLRGIYDQTAKDLDMEGVISPIYLVNSIGSILTQKGEGLLGFNYSIDGPASDPRVQVNPLSILTPGMFREIFRAPPPKVE